MKKWESLFMDLQAALIAWHKHGDTTAGHVHAMTLLSDWSLHLPASPEFLRACQTELERITRPLELPMRAARLAEEEARLTRLDALQTFGAYLRRIGEERGELKRLGWTDDGDMLRNPINTISREFHKAVEHSHTSVQFPATALRIIQSEINAAVGPRWPHSVQGDEFIGRAETTSHMAASGRESIDVYVRGNDILVVTDRGPGTPSPRDAGHNFATWQPPVLALYDAWKAGKEKAARKMTMPAEWFAPLGKSEKPKANRWRAHGRGGGRYAPRSIWFTSLAGAERLQADDLDFANGTIEAGHALPSGEVVPL